MANGQDFDHKLLLYRAQQSQMAQAFYLPWHMQSLSRYNAQNFQDVF